MPERVDRRDLSSLLSGHAGATDLRATLEAASEPGELLTVLGRYIQFNSAFGPGLANLAGEIGARQGSFRDPEEPVRLAQDRAAEVAADFFHAAVDEFDDRATAWRDTHRTLAQATLKGMGAHFGFAPAELNEAIRVNAATEEAMRQVSEGYGLGASLDDERLFRAMGFHAGSEVLADEEFTVIDRVLRDRRPELVAALRGMKVEILGGRHDAYYWIHIHTSVEADHFEAALAGVNKALRFYAGPTPPATVKGWILDGFRGFAGVQAQFMAHLGEP
jgi:hypothetical protein